MSTSSIILARSHIICILYPIFLLIILILPDYKQFLRCLQALRLVYTVFQSSTRLHSHCILHSAGRLSSLFYALRIPLILLIVSSYSTAINNSSNKPISSQHLPNIVSDTDFICDPCSTRRHYLLLFSLHYSGWLSLLHRHPLLFTTRSEQTWSVCQVIQQFWHSTHYPQSLGNPCIRYCTVCSIKYRLLVYPSIGAFSIHFLHPYQQIHQTK